MMQTNREFHEPKQGKRRKSEIVLRKREAHGEDLRTSYIGWNIKKKNWLSLLVLMPVRILLAYLCKDGLKHAIHQFPSLLIMVVFCILQVFLYLYIRIYEDAFGASRIDITSK